MATFAEFEAARKGLTTPVSADEDYPVRQENPTAAGFGNSDVDRLLAEAKGTLARADAFDTSIGGKKHVISAEERAPKPEEDLFYKPLPHESPASAVVGSAALTAAKTAKGLVESPGDALRALLNLPSAAAQIVSHPIDTATNLWAHRNDPVNAILDPRTDPEAMGSQLGQVLLTEGAGKFGPGMAEAAATKTPQIVGKTMAAAGRGAESLGTSRVAKLASKYGPMEAVLRMDPYGAAAAVAPKVLEYGGQGLQKLGNRIAEMDPVGALRNAMTKGKAAITSAFAPAVEADPLANLPESWKPFVSREAVGTEIPYKAEPGGPIPTSFASAEHLQDAMNWAKQAGLSDAEVEKAFEQSIKQAKGLAPARAARKATDAGRMDAAMQGLRDAVAKRNDIGASASPVGSYFEPSPGGQFEAEFGPMASHPRDILSHNGNYDAGSLLAHPGAQSFLAKEAAKNRPLARKLVGSQITHGTPAMSSARRLAELTHLLGVE